MIGLGNIGMLLGLAGMAIPIIIHLLHLRQDPVIDWGAMQFLNLGKQSRRRIQLTELLLLLARMMILGLVALALTRPYLSNTVTESIGGGVRRDLVLIFDGSNSMSRAGETGNLRKESAGWAKPFVGKLGKGDSVAILDSRDHVEPLVSPLAYDLREPMNRIQFVGSTGGFGSSNIPAALSEAFQLIKAGQNPASELIILTDGQRHAWRPSDQKRWDLLKQVYGYMPNQPKLWALIFKPEESANDPNASINELELSRTVLTPELPLRVKATVTNHGPGPISRTVQLLVDGQEVPGTSRVVGPLPPGSKTTVEFKTSINQIGSHLVFIELGRGGDSIGGDDISFAAVRVVDAMNTLLVDGEPGTEPLTGEVDFLRIALAPTDDNTPQVRTKVITTPDLNAEILRSQSVLILANVDRLKPDQLAAVNRFVESGGGLFLVLGDKVNKDFYNDRLGKNGFNWLPARLLDRKVSAHPDPSTFTGPVMSGFATGDDPALKSAEFTAYTQLELLESAAVTARLNTGDPWLVEKPFGKGRVYLLASSLDAEGGTIPVNPDFVPLVHEWVMFLGTSILAPKAGTPGEPLLIELSPPPAAEVESVMHGFRQAKVPVIREGDRAFARIDEASAGVHRVEWPGGFAYGVVNRDEAESDLTELDPAEIQKLSDGWPLIFVDQPYENADRLFTSASASRRDTWRTLIIAAIGFLCFEAWMTRRLVRGRGV